MNIKRIIALISVLAMLGSVLSPMGVFADTKSDAEASIQFTNANRLKLYNSLSSSELSPGDVMAKTYVFEDFNEWSTDRAVMAGESYDGYSSWEDKAREKVGGTMASANGVTLPLSNVGDYGDFTGGSHFLINLLKLTSGTKKIGWFGTSEDGYYGFENSGSAKKVIDTTPTIKVTSNVSETEQPIYTSTTDSLLYVGDTDGDGINNVDDWMMFEGTIVLSYDWLVSPVSKVTTELMTLDNIAIHYSRTNADGTARSNQTVGDFPITGLPIVYYDTNSSKVMMRSHEGIDFSKDNPNYTYVEDETSAKRLRPWKLANDANFFNTTEIAGINKGDWVNLTVVLDIKGTDASDRVIYQREFLNGKLIKNADGESVCTIKPYDTEYTLSTGTSTPPAPENCSLEGYPYDGQWANWAPAEYYGIGVSFANGQASDGWGGIDNLCYRIYNGTKLEKAAYQSDDIVNGNIEIALSTTTGMTETQKESAPHLATAGIVDLGDDANISIVKTNISNDPLALGGTATEGTVNNLKNLSMSNYSYQGTVTGKKYLDSTKVRITGLDSLGTDEAYVVSIDTTDATGKTFRENAIVTDSNDVSFIGTNLYDFIGNDVTAESTNTASGEYEISCNTNKIVLYSADQTAESVTLEGNNQTQTATFNGGKYTFALNGLLAQNTQYSIKKNGVEVAKITPSTGSFVYEVLKNDSGKPTIKYVNASNDNVSGFLIAYNSKADIKAMNIAIPAGGFGEASMNVSGNYENIMFLETLKEGAGEAKLDSINEVVSPFVGTSATVTGNLEDKDKSVMLIVLKGDEWATDAALADAIVYIDTTVTFDDPVTTVDGTPDYKKGDYKFDVVFPSGFSTDKYTFMVYSENEAMRKVVAYGTASDNAGAIVTLKSSAQTALANENTRNALEFYYSYVETLYDDDELSAFYNKVATLISTEMASNPLDGKAKAIELYRQAAIATALSDGKLNNLDKVSTDIKLLNVEPIKGYWENNTGINSKDKETWKSDVAKRLGGKSFESISSGASFEKALVEALILQIVESAESVDAAKNVMKNSFNGLNTLKQSTVTNYTAGTVMNQDYASISALQNALTTANQNGIAPPSGGGMSGGGSGGGGSVSNVIVGNDKDAVISSPEPVPATKYAFSDMISAPWAAEAVATLKEMGVINGKSNTEFAPNDNVTREEFVKMIVLLADINVEHGDMEFDDINESDWFYTPIKAAKQKNIVNGISESTFGVGQKITRQDMAVITKNVLSYLNISMSKKDITFVDKGEIADYATDSISRLVANGIINGYEDNTFKPTGFATRAEAAKMLYGILELIK